MLRRILSGALFAALILVGGRAASPADSPSASDVVRYLTTIPAAGLGGDGPITDAALSDDGKTLALSRGGGAIALYDLSTKRAIAILQGNKLPQSTGDHSGAFESLAISRDGAYIAAGGYNTAGFSDHAGVVDSVTRLWRRSSPQPLHVWKGLAPDAMAFSADNRRLVARSPGMSDTPDIVWTADLGSGAVKRWVAQWKPPLDNFSFYCSPDGFATALPTFVFGPPALLVASGDCKKSIDGLLRPLRLWPIGARLPDAPFSGPLIDVVSYDNIALTPDRKSVVTGDAEHLAVWDVAQRKLRVAGAGVPYDITPRVDALAANNRYAVAIYLDDPSEQGAWDRYFLSVWALADARHIAKTAVRTSSENSRLLLSPDGTRAYVTTPAGIDVWQMQASP
jgi:WD40 repeat protein